jgi:hypothetical protein
VLVGKTRSVRERIGTILFLTAAVTLLGVLLAVLGSVVGLWVWPPQPSSGLAVTCGLIAGAIVLSEMAILPRKWFRGRRLGNTRVWMRWHVWLGMVCLPVVLIHAGFGFGGPLPTATLVLFLAVTVSGIWGLIMQQWLPQKMLAEIPGEVVASQIDFVGEYHAAEAFRLVEALVTVPPEAAAAAPLVIGRAATELLAFRDTILIPYLRGDWQSPLAARTEADRSFVRLRDATPSLAHPILDRLRELTELRRQWDAQARLNFWLHNWLVIHLPLSVAMTGLMLLHAVRALKYW